MAQILGLPKLSPTMEEGVLVRWTKKEGDKVSPGDLIAEVETDKANMDFNVEDEGVLLKLLAKEGDTVKLGAPVAIIGTAGEDITALLAQATGGGAKAAAPAAPKADAKPAPAKADAKPAPKADAKPAPAKADAKPAPKADPKPAPKQAPTKASAAPPTAGARLLASPLAKTLAIELGIDLRNVKGSGPGGRIVERDVRALADGGATAGADSEESASAAAEESEADVESQALTVRGSSESWPMQSDSDGEYTDVPASTMRRRIAARLTEAKRDVPHFYLQRSIDAAPLLAFRARLNDLLGARSGADGGPAASGSAPKISVNDLVVKAVALALRRVPDCNAAWAGEAIRKFHRVHVGIAVAIEDGLVTPVVRDADRKGLGAIAAEVKDLAERAKSKRLKSHEITGSTFTVSNLGMFGIERFTAILNPPEAGILAIGAVLDTPVVKDGQVVAGKRMTVSMSCDHRVIDGALGAKWLQAFAELLEKPESLAL